LETLILQTAWSDVKIGLARAHGNKLYVTYAKLLRTVLRYALLIFVATRSKLSAEISS